jgi:hypothetical protein
MSFVNKAKIWVREPKLFKFKGWESYSWNISKSFENLFERKKLGKLKMLKKKLNGNYIFGGWVGGWIGMKHG